MNIVIKEYVLFLILLVIIDSFYLFGLKDTHNKVFEKVQKSKLEVNLKYGSLFYLLAPIAYIYFIKPLSSKDKNNITQIAKYGALMGLLMYGTFDITNLALFKDYPSWYALMDTLWGTFAIMLTSILTFKIIN
jgi:uncharacterized membrane protein